MKGWLNWPWIKRYEGKEQPQKSLEPKGCSKNFPPRVCYGAEIGGCSSGGTERSRKEEVEGGKHMREFPSPDGHNQQSLAHPCRAQQLSCG